ncbi:YegS/Rv2252/BmrU family lipid kinase [Metabacillus idriensis]|uniref:YegS/Rv2252/BmrU family lipid kinase n=1 Tax=Metabacillus idriensis TaxID=324768 RepID=A0A6I2MEL6_9BACI|nr:YegS/Rv2252/BmrU family lipid kinase [Metabacillus idriensis]MCM3597122.1 YegS/Rv2252/BmrU family lipid kinase [Metabacillus idriensis]MRX55607.1 YegS/Rv2252/BmrU family lipid kinase [Metabacillus idriensis]OHR67604.1 lipid kinase [Bacillus sp. HMSC76G11]
MAKYKKGMLIYNGNAGQKDAEKTLGICVPIISLHVEQLLLLQTSKPLDAQEYCRSHGENMDIVIILGGDGTVHECINGLGGLIQRPVIAILPGGTCNDFSRTLGIPQNLKKATESLFAGEIRGTDAAETSEGYFLNFWGIGLVAETSENINDTEKALLGKVSYFLSAFRTIKSMKPFHFRLKLDDTWIEEEAIMVLIANGKIIGTNVLPHPDIKIDDGLADIFIIKEASFSLIKEVMTMKDNIEWNHIDSQLMHYQASSMQIETKEEMSVDTDGEVYSKTPETITILHNHFQMLSPKEQI